MEKFKVSFVANNQQLTATGTKHASDTYADIEATFALGERWTDMDSVSAVWWNDFTRIATVLDSEGKCTVPHEVLMRKGCVRVNLVGSVVEDGELVTRLTSYSAEAVHVNEKIKLTGNEPQTITPSQYEQFVENVKADADRAESAKESAQDASASAQGYAQTASASASSASESATLAEQAKQSARASAQNAQISAQTAENAKDDAESARDEILGMRATATTLAEGSEATASYSNGLLTLGIPRGDTGATGAKGDTGETGATPNLTIGTIETLEPTESATATITGTAENPVLNLGLPQGRTGEVSYEDLSSLLPKDTASGDIISIPDGQSIIPVESLKVTLEPIQDLHGYDKPWAAGAGKNKLDDSNPVRLLNCTYVDGVLTATQTSAITNFNPVLQAWNGSSYVGTIGTRTGTSYAFTKSSTFNRMSFGHGDTSTDVKIWFDVSNLTDDVDYIFSWEMINSSTPFKWKNMMVRLSSVSDATFEPYSNICPISGRTDVDTHRTGKNLWDKAVANGYVKIDNVKVGATYTATAKMIDTSTNTYCYIRRSVSGTTNYEDVGYVIAIRTENAITFTAEDGYDYYMWCNSSYTNVKEVQLEYGSTATSYEPYQGDTYTTDLGQTVYGGKLDVVSGELVVDMKTVDLSTLSWSATSLNRQIAVLSDAKPAPNNDTKAKIFCDRYPTDTANALITKPTEVLIAINNNKGVMCRTSDGNTPQGQLVYELNEPQTIQLTPQEVYALLGQNNVWADSGAVEVVYKADVTKWVEKKLN